MHGDLNEVLVVIAVLIAVVTSYTALDLAARFGAATTPTARNAWLVGAAFSLGGGIWAMHFVAMLAHSMPGVRPSYDLGLTSLSFLLAVGATGAGFATTLNLRSRMNALVLSGPLMGFGIAAMHYTGMAALQMPMAISYDPIWGGASIVVAVGAATVALWLAFGSTGMIEKLVAAVVMGAAISGMHFAGMFAASFSPLHSPVPVAGGVDQGTLAVIVSAITFAILSLALLAATVDRRLAQLSQWEANALRKSEERFRLLYRRTPLPLHAVDGEDNIVDVSDAWLALLGFARQDVIGKPVRSFMTPASEQRRALISWPALLKEGEARDIDVEFVTRASKVIDVEMTGRTERDAQGNFLSCFEGLVDVTARKEMESTLRQTQKMELLGQLTSGVAHDFNNLLAVISGSLEMLRKQIDENDLPQRLIDTAMQGVQRGAVLTQRMLAFGRRQTLDPKPVDVIALLSGMFSLLQRSLGPQYELVLPDGALMAVANVDQNQLEMALLNLILNARDAMGEGGRITITVQSSHEGFAGRCVAIEVADEGIGMDPVTLSRATEPFFTTKGPSAGTGLGLSMVHGFAAQSGGQLHLGSQPGKGTHATIVLPVALDPVGSPVASAALQAKAPMSASFAKVLVVDDDGLILMNTQAMLEDMGHEVLTAANAIDALQILTAEVGVDLVITDHAMPKMTGMQLAEAIHLSRPELPIILATGYADLPHNPATIVCKLNKPFLETELEKALRVALPSFHC